MRFCSINQTFAELEDQISPLTIQAFPWQSRSSESPPTELITSPYHSGPITFLLDGEVVQICVHRQLYRKIRSAAADGDYAPRLCHDELRRRKSLPLFLLEKGQATGPRNTQPTIVQLRASD